MLDQLKEEFDTWARAGGFSHVRGCTIMDPTPVPEVYTPRHYESRDAMKASREIGSLVIQVERDER